MQFNDHNLHDPTLVDFISQLEAVKGAVNTRFSLYDVNGKHVSKRFTHWGRH